MKKIFCNNLLKLFSLSKSQTTLLRVLKLKIGQKQPEDEMRYLPNYYQATPKVSPRQTSTR